MPSSTRRTTRCWAAAGSTAPFTARRGRACSRNAARSAAARTGDAKLTGAYDLPARFVVHTVGPVWQGGAQGEPALLARCYRRCYEIAAANGVESIAFPAIGTGVYGYPLDRATHIAVTETRDHLEAGGTLRRVVFACFGADARDMYGAVIDDIFAGR